MRCGGGKREGKDKRCFGGNKKMRKVLWGCRSKKKANTGSFILDLLLLNYRLTIVFLGLDDLIKYFNFNFPVISSLL